jgi:hypothetical protein
MRCYCCNNPLSGVESTRRFKESNEFTDMCDACLATILNDNLETVEGNAEDDDLFDEDGNPVEK